MIRTGNDARQADLLCLPPGSKGSGYVRYGAAMYFYQQGQISAETLEVYRVCCKIDAEDPLITLKTLGLAGEVTRAPAGPPR